MDTAFNFLLQNWLWVGLEVLVFFGIGLLFAKLIWGRQSRRVSYAVDECMNLSGQWYALGSSQRDLFKKLSSRWQDDRESWERQLRRMADELSEKDELILRLEGNDDSGTSGKSEEELKEARQRIEELEKQLAKEKGSEDANESATFSEETETLRERIAELENDLVEAHDTLHELRSQPKEVRSLSAQTDKSRKENTGTGKDVALERSNAQLEALLAQREREFVYIRESFSLSESSPVKARSSVLLSGDDSRLAEVEAELEREIEDHAETVQGLYQRISDLEAQLLEQEDQLSGVSRSVAGFGETFMHSQKAKEESADSTIEDENRAELDKAKEEIVDLRKVIKTKEKELEAVRSEVDSSKKSSVEVEKLMCELKDAHDEMADVRLGYNKQRKQLESVDLPPADVMELGNKIADLESSLNKAEEELRAMRKRHSESSSEEEKLRHEKDELEAIIQDRDAEVEDAVTELKSNRETLRSLRVKIAQQEGDLEGLTDVNRKMEAELREKRSIAEMLTSRITEVERALRDRYQEMNRLSVALDHSSGGYERTAAEAKTLAKELGEVRWENGLMRKKLEELERSVESGQEGYEETVRELEERRLSVRLLEDRYRLTKDEVRDVKDSLQLAHSELDSAKQELEAREKASQELQDRIDALTSQLEVKEQTIREFKNLAEGRRITLTEKDDELKETRETLASKESELEEAKEVIASRDAELGDAREQLSELESQLEEARNSISEKDSSIDSLQEGNNSLEEQVSDKERNIAELESTISDLRNRVDESSSETDSLKTQLSDTKVSLENTQVNRDHLEEELGKKTRQLGDFSERIHRLVHRNEEGGGPVFSNALGSGSDPGVDPNFEALGLAISELETRALRAEESYGVCEQELLEAKQKVMLVKQQHQVELARRDREIEVMREHVFVAEEQKVKAVRALEERTQNEAVVTGTASVQKVQRLNALVTTLREEIAARDLAIRELEDQSDYERSREALRDEPVAEEAPDERRKANRVEQHHTSPAASNENSFSLFFEEGYAHLSGSAIDQIDRFSREYRGSGWREHISIAGYSGDEGSNALNESLSARRADAVRERLVENGIPQGKIVVQARGYDEQGPEGDERWKARRVEVVLVPEAVAETIN